MEADNIKYMTREEIKGLDRSKIKSLQMTSGTTFILIHEKENPHSPFARPGARASRLCRLQRAQLRQDAQHPPLGTPPGARQDGEHAGTSGTKQRAAAPAPDRNDPEVQRAGLDPLFPESGLHLRHDLCPGRGDPAV